jgi:hypothetical protein
MEHMVKRISVLVFLSAFCTNVLAQVNNSHFELEAGTINTENMEIHGYNQANATDGWKKTGPDVRLEYWETSNNSWNYGYIFQPLFLNYSGVLKNNLNYKGKVYNAGDSATLNYQFPTLRWSANYPIFQFEGGANYVRAGGSVIIRYARVELKTSTNAFSDTNLLPIPVINLETNTNIGNGFSFFTRSDFLPSPDGNVFLDGLFDVFLGVRKKINNRNNLDAGVRLFFGGYDPKTPDEYANRIFFDAVVVRFSW